LVFQHNVAPFCCIVDQLTFVLYNIGCKIIVKKQENILRLLIVVIVLSILFYRPFCKWICPLGAIYSLFNKVSLLKITVDSSKCVGCGQCSKACKMDVDVCKTPDHPECIRCGACIKACPKDAICYRFMGKSCQKNDNR
jgi:ferredoxin-type protein NapH